jgi:hypothetical protein
MLPSSSLNMTLFHGDTLRIFSDAFVGVVFAMVFAAATASSSAMSFATASFKNFSAASRLFSSLSMHLLRIV